MEKRAKRLENGEVVWALRNGDIGEKLKDLTFDKESLVGKLIEAGSGTVVAKYNPNILTGRYIEVWRQNNEGNPEFDIEVDSSGQIITKTASQHKFKELYPDSTYGADFDVSVFDMGINRNISSFKVKKKSEGKINKFTIVVKDADKKMLWLNSWYATDLFEGGGKNFELKGSSRVDSEVNLAKNAKIVKGEVFNGWVGLTDGIKGTIAPFAGGFEGGTPNEVVLDLGEAKTVNAFRAFKATTSAFKGLQVGHSTDNENFTMLGAVSTLNNSNDVVLWTLEEQPVRYIKIKFIQTYNTFKHDFLKDKSILAEFQALKF